MITTPKTQRKLTGILVNFLLCSVIGVVIFQLGWVPALWVSLLISYVFGFICHTASTVISNIYPRTPNYLQLALAWLVALLIGGSFAYWLLYTQGVVVQSNAFSKFMKLMLISFVFGSAVVYFFYSREQAFAMKAALKEAELKRSEKEKALLLSQLKLMQSQIEPHFLFNTLANLKGLIQQNPAKASLLLDKLTELLRQSLNATREQEATLSDELNFCEAYLSIQKIRLEERLNFTIEISNDVNVQSAFPSLLLQPLVENAIQHGIEPSEEGGEILVSLTMASPGKLVIQVKDTGVGFSSSENSGHGVGLTNIRSRLDSLYGEKGKLLIQECTNKGVISRIEVPVHAE